MIRAQRRRHLLIWLILGPLILLGFVLGLSVRRTAPIQDNAESHSVLEVNR